ncbi:DUF736 domain-containing protein [Inquilinus limosus]|uniref:DUF736 domain-containing protein n=1 Tax=Inquilinus limosus TaxID=171674 RepID=UPI00042069F8|nr:DUF736 family protein [Inquilinus limosus]
MTTIGIGTLYRNRDVIEGPVKTLLFQDRIRLVPNPRAADSPKAPDLLVLSSGEDEIGGAWACRREDRSVSYNVQIHDPHISRPIHATLCQSEQDGDRFDLYWSH